MAGAANSIVSLQNWPQARFVRGCWKLRCKKTLLTFRMSHGFDFATQNLGAREEFSHLIRKEPAPRKTVAFPKVWQLYRLGFDFGVRMWYSEEEEGSAPGRLHVCDQ